jgi:hypothetical protein
MPHQVGEEMRDCIANCSDCHNICVETSVHCLELGGEHAAGRHIRLLLDCAQICATSADFMLRGSELHARTCGVCAEICEMCAVACEQMAGGDDMMLRCAGACRRCAESCRKMAA